MWIELAPTDFRVAAPENVYPMTHVGFDGVIKSDKYEGFVFRCFFPSAVVELNKLLLHYPLAAHSTFNGAAIAHFAGNAPVADEIIEKRILKCQRRAGSN